MNGEPRPPETVARPAGERLDPIPASVPHGTGCFFTARLAF